MTLPLDGVRVIDLTNVVAGPLASYQLVMLGADVIKIEIPGVGDLSRKMGADPALGKRQMGVSFLTLNAGKKSLTLNLKDDRGKEILKRLVRGADVVLENFRPGTMDDLGLGYDVLKDVNPSIVYCAISGFGQEGPLAQRPAYDQIIQGFCGLMSITGDERTAPTRAGYIVCDSMAAMTASFAICAALYRRAKTGEGEMIDVSMLDASLVTMAAWPVSNYLNAGHAPRPMGNENFSASPSGTFRTADGVLNLVINEEKQWQRLCDALEAPALKTDSRFADRFQRIAHRVELRTVIEELLQAKSAEEWAQQFVEAGVPAGPILKLPDIMRHPHIESRQLVKHFSGVPGVGRDIAVPRLGFRLANDQPDVDSPPPLLSEHTDEILAAAGCSAREIQDLRDAGVV